MLHVDTGIQFAKYKLQQICVVDLLAEKTIGDVVSALLEGRWTPWQTFPEKAGTEEHTAGQRLTNRARKYNTLCQHLKITSGYTVGMWHS